MPKIFVLNTVINRRRGEKVAISLKSSPTQMTSLGIPLMEIKAGPSFRAGCLQHRFFTPDNLSEVSFEQ